MAKLAGVVVAAAQALAPHREEQESLAKAIAEERALALQAVVVAAKVALVGTLAEALAEQQEVEQLIPIPERASRMLLEELAEVVQEVVEAEEPLTAETVAAVVVAAEIHPAVLVVQVVSFCKSLLQV
jgi:hypothetical protein